MKAWRSALTQKQARRLFPQVTGRIGRLAKAMNATQFKAFPSPLLCNLCIRAGIIQAP